MRENRNGEPGTEESHVDEKENAEYVFWCPVCGYMEFPLTREEAEALKKEHDRKCF